MKTVKSALLGQRRLIEGNQDALIYQLTQIIKEHRVLIITRLLSDLPTYLDYKFQLRANPKQLLEIKERLLDLKNSGVQLTKYEAPVRQLESSAVIHLTNEPFYNEIDDYIVKNASSIQQLGFINQ